MARKYQICKRCIMDTSDPDIQFDADGFCNHCTGALERIKKNLLPPKERELKLHALVEKIKEEGKGKKYDCIIGVSGGVDSTTTAYYVKKLGLRPRAVHYENHLDAELTIENVRKLLDFLDIELYTYVVDWVEVRDLIISFLKASVANCEIPTDNGIAALLFKTAYKEKTRFILTGNNLMTESILPKSWGHYYQDLKHIKAIHRRFGTVPLRTMPTIGLSDYFYYIFVKRIRNIPFLNYIEYNKDDAKKMLTKEFGWQDYGAKHFESIWTRFFQGYYLPNKFGFDKRRAHQSSLICAGTITREEALTEMEKPIYQEGMLEDDTQFLLEKLDLTQDEFDEFLHAPPKPHSAYPGHFLLFNIIKKYTKTLRRIATGA